MQTGQEPVKKPARSKIVWVAPLLEALLIGAAIYFFADYWIMLPVRYRVMGLCGLAFVIAVFLYRLLKHARR
jgi:hypothetical protein